MKDNKKIVSRMIIVVLVFALVLETIIVLEYRTTVTTVSKGLEAEQKDSAVGNETKAMTDKIELINRLIDEHYLYDVDEEAVEDGMFTGMLYGLGDVYSTYYTANDMEDINLHMEAEYSGIGAVLTTDAVYGLATVVKTYEGSPSFEAGMRQGDYIVEVAGEDVSALDLSTVVSKIKGEDGTPVSIKVYRAKEDEYVTFDLTRRRVEIPSVAGEMLNEDIGYIQIESWDMLTNSQFEAAMERLLAEGMKELVIDVRNNPGGLVQAAADVLDYFVEDGGKLLYSVDKNDEEKDYMAKDGKDCDIPLVVLTNGQSASASEIFAGGIRDYKAGMLVGEKTFGKGIVQNIIDIGNGEAVKLTVAEYYLPSGVCIHGEGIEPDVNVQLSETLKNKAVISHEEDTQLQKALELLGDKTDS